MEILEIKVLFIDVGVALCNQRFFSPQGGIEVDSLAEVFNRDEQRLARQAMDYRTLQRQGLRSRAEERAEQLKSKQKAQAKGHENATTPDITQAELGLGQQLEKTNFPTLIAPSPVVSALVTRPLIDVKVLAKREENRRGSAILQIAADHSDEHGTQRTGLSTADSAASADPQEGYSTCTIQSMAATKELIEVRRKRAAKKAKAALEKEGALWRENRPQSARMRRDVDMQTHFISTNSTRQIEAIHASYIMDMLDLDCVKPPE
jgi:hypothetical protein